MATKLDEAVEVALSAESDALNGGNTNRYSMRAALLAGMKVLMGPVVKEWRESSDQHYAAYERTSTRFNSDWESKAKSETLSDCADDVERIYAPSLGEGDGR